MIVCADDYGLAEDIDRSILELAAEKRLSAVSCMVLLERCTPRLMAELGRCHPTLDVGLHFCLTDEGLPLAQPSSRVLKTGTLPSFRGLMWRCVGRTLSVSEVGCELARQYNLFLTKCGRAPDFIDGHLHVHQLPAVRTALVRFALRLPVDSRPYIRNTSFPLRELRRRRLPCWKAALIGSLGARMRLLLQNSGLPTNSGFAGIYDFREWRNYAQYFPRFVDCLSAPNGILVVHPGQVDAWRKEEFATLKSYPFPSGSPARFRRTPG